MIEVLQFRLDRPFRVVAAVDGADAAAAALRLLCVDALPGLEYYSMRDAWPPSKTARRSIAESLQGGEFFDSAPVVPLGLAGHPIESIDAVSIHGAPCRLAADGHCAEPETGVNKG